MIITDIRGTVTVRSFPIVGRVFVKGGVILRCTTGVRRLVSISPERYVSFEHRLPPTIDRAGNGCSPTFLTVSRDHLGVSTVFRSTCTTGRSFLVVTHVLKS